MATVITSECINCGACEPECPNTAIYQGGVQWELGGQSHAPLSEDIFYIVPEKCTECVGFYDQEACAAVCPVDCCIPDPEREESEEVLLGRAKELHPEEEFGEGYPSRFRAGGGEAGVVGGVREGGNGAREGAVGEAVAVSAPAPAPVAAVVAPVTTVNPTPAPRPAPASPQPAPAAAQETLSISIPDMEEWEVPISCFHCDGEYTVPFKHFRTGVVFYCPHCTGSFVITSTIHKNVVDALNEFHRHWTEAFVDFEEKRRRELEAFEKKQRQELEVFNERLNTVNAKVNPPGKLKRRLSLLGFQRVG